MPTADITRAEVAGLIQDAYSTDFLNAAVDSSIVLQAFPTVSMGTKTERLPVLATIPHANWVTEDSTADEGTKPTSKFSWANKTLVAEEVAVIIPVHENVVDDATEDILGEITRLGGQAMGYALDAAVLFGVNKPATWTDPDLFAAATASGNLTQISATDPASDLVGAILQNAGLVIGDGEFEPDKLIARRSLRMQLANLRNTDGTPIYLPSLSATPGATDQVAGMTTLWARGTVAGDQPVFDATKATALIVDSTAVRIGVRQDITVKFLDQATVNGINLAEKDMVALRFKARYAYCLRNIVAQNNTEAVTRNPVGAVTPAA
ncbi:phage major capsid protein [Actinomyces qiguomingii]|uniref:phage major capsid protein n=2 Tax=Actinomyces qiguomingii TaxID=2057800 RepID=UPI000CA08F8D|nr:phage major capsid protein [Actinomyces qiguomingii]